MRFTLRSDQSLAVDHSLAWAANPPGDRPRLLLASPTGSGKSVIQLALRERLPGLTFIATPRVEIIRGFLEKLDVTPADREYRVVEQGQALNIFTPIRLRNLLLSGDINPLPDFLLVDEAHHDTAETYSQLDALLGGIPWIGFTATPYRGTPRGSAALRELWGEPVWILTIPEAAARRIIALPTYEILPLVDDDLIEVENGELVTEQAEALLADRVDSLVKWVGRYYDGRFDKPTMIAVPGVSSAEHLAHCLDRAGIYAETVTGNTPADKRQNVFRACLDRRLALVQIQVVSEGVDLPIRRLVDCSPTLSPVRWLQQLGRITRPTDEQPEYVCCNRNLLRHGYLLEGCLPPSVYKEAETAFGGPSRRAAVRAIGLEGVGRLKGAELPLLGGLTAIAYSCSKLEGSFRRDYFVIVHPLRPVPLWATRTNETEPGRTVSYGKWQRCEPPTDLAGFASLPPAPISEKQQVWWKKCASFHGLDPEAEITRKTFPALPVLNEIRARV